MNTYILRSLKYIIKMVVLLGLLFVAMALTKTSAVSGEQLFTELFFSTKGLILLCALLAVAAAYPKFGFVKRDVRANMDEQRERIVNVFAACGYELEQHDNNKMTFRAMGKLKRALMMWDDAIDVESDGNYPSISGVRKEVVRVEFKLNSYLRDE